MTVQGNPIAEAIETLNSPSHPGVLNVRDLPLFIDGKQVKVARDYFGSFKLFLPSRNGDEGIQDASLSAGFAITTNAGGIVFSSTRSDASDLFAHLSIEVCRQLSETNLAVGDVIAERITHWKELLASLEMRQPSTQEQLGLLGELVTLRQMVAEAGPDISGTWFGPLGSRHDFEAENWALEVKASLSVNRKIGSLSSKNQLETNKNGHLRLIHLQFELALGGLTISHLVKELRENCNDDLLSSRLQRFFPDGLNELPNWATSLQVTIADANLFLCDDSFPRLRLDPSDPVVSRISNLKYDLNLEGLESKFVGDPASPLFLTNLGVLSW